MTARVAINGLGRATLKIVLENPDLELAAVNDIAPADNLAYLLKYDKRLDDLGGQFQLGANVPVQQERCGGRPRRPARGAGDP